MREVPGGSSRGWGSGRSRAVWRRASYRQRTLTERQVGQPSSFSNSEIEPWVDGGIVHEVRVSDDRAIRQCSNSGLQVEYLGHGNRHHRGPKRREDPAQLGDARCVRPASASHIDGVADLQDVAAIERAGFANLVDRTSEFSQNLACPINLRLSRVRARAADDRDVPEHHHGVFDEHGVGTVVRSRNLDRLPSALLKRADVASPLFACLHEVHGDLFDVVDDAVVEQWTGCTNECDL